MADTTTRYLTRRTALWNERSSWEDHWRELSDYFSPRTGRFVRTKRNKGDKRHGKLLDNTTLFASRVTAAGLMAGMTSPARPWFKLETTDKELMKRDAVRKWTNDVTVLMRTIFSRSNTYRALQSVYGELLPYGTAADIVLDDFDDVLRHYNCTVGEYAIATDGRGVVDTLYREFEMTVAQIVSQFVYDEHTGKFDWSKVSPSIKNLWDNHGQNAWRPVLHAIEPRHHRPAGSVLSQHMRFASCYMEVGRDNDGLLRESGFRNFPALCPRWDVTPGDIYGNSPGMESLGDAKELQHKHMRKALAVDYKVKPPLQIPDSMAGKPLAMLPGGANYVPQTSSGQAIRSAFEVDLDIGQVRDDIQDIRQRINTAFYVDMFLMLAQDDRSGVTAREVAERHEEKLLMLGPVLERLHNELASPLIDLAFTKIVENKLLPPPPQEMQGADINVRFVSVLAQAQQAVGLQSVDRLLGTVGSIANFVPDALDKLNTDEIIDHYADMLGVDPDLIVADEKVAIIRQKRAEAQAQQAAAQQAEQTAKTAATMGSVDSKNLYDVMTQFSGYNAPVQ